MQGAQNYLLKIQSKISTDLAEKNWNNSQIFQSTLKLAPNYTCAIHIQVDQVLALDQQARRRGLKTKNPTSSYAKNFALFLSASTLVMAAVSVVLPWSTWPIVPTFTLGFFLDTDEDLFCTQGEQWKSLKMECGYLLWLGFRTLYICSRKLTLSGK